MLLFASCGQQHNAESIVKEFMRQNLNDASQLNDIEFADIDSTKYINESMVKNIREAANRSPQYKHGIIYNATSVVGRQLIIARVHYKIGEKKFRDTYYLDENVTAVVAFKNN